MAQAAENAFNAASSLRNLPIDENKKLKDYLKSTFGNGPFTEINDFMFGRKENRQDPSYREMMRKKRLNQIITNEVLDQINSVQCDERVIDYLHRNSLRIPDDSPFFYYRLNTQDINSSEYIKTGKIDPSSSRNQHIDVEFQEVAQRDYILVPSDLQTKPIIYIENLIDIQLSQTQESVYATEHYDVDLKKHISATILYGNPHASRSRNETGSFTMIQVVPGRGIIGNIQQVCSQAARSIGWGTKTPRYMNPKKRKTQQVCSQAARSIGWGTQTPRYMTPSPPKKQRARTGGKKTKKQKVKKLKKRSKKIKKQKRSTRKRKVE